MVVTYLHMGILRFSRDIGIDIGTSRTRIYVPHRGVVFDEPSVAAFSADHKNTLLCIGTQAKEMIGRTDERAVAVPTMISGAVQDEKVVEQYLETSLRQSRGIFKFVRHDMLTGIPTKATSMEQRAIMQVCKRAGARNVFTEQNAILAALGIGAHKDELRGRMVADIGAGLTEAAVISLGGMSSSHAVKVGGNDMDRAIAQHVKQQQQLLISEDTARKVKETIGSVMPQDNPKEIRVKGSDAQSRLPRIITLTSNDIADAVQEVVTKILETIAVVFQKTPPELTSDIIDQRITLTGGTAKLHGIDQTIGKYINAPVQVADQPEHAVIRGIGRSIQTGHLNFHKRVLLSGQ